MVPQQIRCEATEYVCDLRTVDHVLIEPIIFSNLRSQKNGWPPKGVEITAGKTRILLTTQQWFELRKAINALVPSTHNYYSRK